MNTPTLQARLAQLAAEDLPLPGAGATAARHQRLFQAAEEDVSLAKLAEAHWDAVAILDEAGRSPEPGAVYGVWASEIPGQPLVVHEGRLSGTKTFCSGYGLITHALVTVGSDDGRLLEVEVRPGATLSADQSGWHPEAFRATQTGSVTFAGTSLGPDAEIGPRHFYLERPGFWHGACGPAACWAGGAAGLLRYAEASRREDPHTLAHRAALRANAWALQALLASAGNEIDQAPAARTAGQVRALSLRHLVEQLATDSLRRFARAYGPFPLAMDPAMSRRFHETEIFLRQSHGERDLEVLGRLPPWNVLSP